MKKIMHGYMLMLSDDLIHGGCLGNYDLFRFHLALKQLNKRAQEKLFHDNDDVIKKNYKEFPDVALGKKNSVTDSMREKSTM